jgi:PPOX class probable F420-dependent enzyme
MTMSAEEIDEFLNEERLAHFATIDDGGQPRIRPLGYLWRDGIFYFTTRLDHRHTGRDLRSNPRVAVSVASDDRPYRAVIAHGRAEVVGKDEELLLAISGRYGMAAARRWLGSALKEPDRVVFKVEPETLLTWNYGKGDSTHKQDQGVSTRTTLS